MQSGAQTGLADRISAGEFGHLAGSRAVAFRADFGGALPAPDERYWRGPVYEAYDGVNWTQVRSRGPSPSVEPGGPPLAYTLTLEPNGRPWLPALDVPTALPPGTFLTNAFQAVTPRPPRPAPATPSRAGRPAWGGREPGTAGVRPAAAARGEPARPRPGLPLAVPDAGGQGGGRPDPPARGRLHLHPRPPTLPERDRVDALLFGSRRGFCEHYASAFAFLMRAAGLPARIVGGYLGGEVNPDGGYLIVRAQDAHAWTEVWLPGRGWVRVDPTAAVAPARVNAGLATALSSPTARAAPVPTPLRRAALRLDALQTRWNAWVAGYDGTQQRDLLAQVGVGRVGGVPYLALAGGCSRSPSCPSCSPGAPGPPTPPPACSTTSPAACGCPALPGRRRARTPGAPAWNVHATPRRSAPPFMRTTRPGTPPTPGRPPCASCGRRCGG